MGGVTREMTIERRRTPDERYRSGWCCDYDFEQGTYRTSDCISRTRNADVVAKSAREAERTRLRVVVEEFIGYMPAELGAAIAAEGGKDA